MSLISDALKKVQEERKKNSPSFSPLPTKKKKVNRPALILILFCGLAGLVFLFKYLIIKPTSPSRIVQHQQKFPLLQQKQPIQPTTVANDSQQSSSLQSPIKPDKTENQKLETVSQQTSPIQPKSASIPQNGSTDQGRIKIQPTTEKKAEKNIRAEQSINENRPNELISSGDRLFAEKNYLSALESYRQALEIAQNNREIYLKVYRTLKTLENWSLAKAYLQEAYKKWPTDYELGIGYLITLLKNGEYQAVVELSTALLETYARDPALFTYRGLGYFHLRQYPSAIENFQQSLQISSSGFENYYYLGLIADNTGNYQQAVQFYRRFLEAANNEPKFSRHVRWAGERIKLIEKNLGGQ